MFERKRADLLFDVMGRRYKKGRSNTMILESSKAVSTEVSSLQGEILMRGIDGIFDQATELMMQSMNFRSAERETDC